MHVSLSAADSGALAGALEVMRVNQDPSEPDLTEFGSRVTARRGIGISAFDG